MLIKIEISFATLLLSERKRSVFATLAVDP